MILVTPPVWTAIASATGEVVHLVATARSHWAATSAPTAHAACFRAAMTEAGLIAMMDSVIAKLTRARSVESVRRGVSPGPEARVSRSLAMKTDMQHVRVQEQTIGECTAIGACARKAIATQRALATRAYGIRLQQQQQ
mmetsp:Transcript_46145/g.76607  ORF Transcript_46145/g.76607 Transcript_46145/m.76607 type:complete len:139 (-) Transcript_46145:377-793(-)